MSIKKFLQTNCNILEYDCLASTNDTAKEAGLNNAKENTVIIVKKQTNGRGRLSRSFFSPENSGIYMSILLRPEISMESIYLITPAAAVAVAKAIDEVCEVDTKIKWVNDIFLNDKKVCGILCESTFLKDSFFSVLGIGVNLYSPKNDFPEEIKTIAGAVFKEKPENEIRERLIAKIIDNFQKFYKDLEQKDFISVYREKSNLIGESITYEKNGETIPATVLDIDDNAHLIVKTENGEILTLFAGEVSVKKRTV